MAGARDVVDLLQAKNERKSLGMQARREEALWKADRAADARLEAVPMSKTLRARRIPTGAHTAQEWSFAAVTRAGTRAAHAATPTTAAAAGVAARSGPSVHGSADLLYRSPTPSEALAEDSRRSEAAREKQRLSAVVDEAARAVELERRTADADIATALRYPVGDCPKDKDNIADCLHLKARSIRASLGIEEARSELKNTGRRRANPSRRSTSPSTAETLLPPRMPETTPDASSSFVPPQEPSGPATPAPQPRAADPQQPGFSAPARDSSSLSAQPEPNGLAPVTGPDTSRPTCASSTPTLPPPRRRRHGHARR